MKNSTIFKVLAAIVTVAGIVYVVAAYGDKIVSWAKRMVRRSAPEFAFEECDCDDCDFDECDCEDEE